MKFQPCPDDGNLMDWIVNAHETGEGNRWKCSTCGGFWTDQQIAEVYHLNALADGETTAGSGHRLDSLPAYDDEEFYDCDDGYDDDYYPDHDDAPWPDPDPSPLARLKRFGNRLRWRWYAFWHKGDVSDIPF